MKRIFSVLCLFFLLSSVANAGYYRNKSFGRSINTGMKNNQGTKKCPNGYKVNKCGTCKSKSLFF